MQNEVLFRVKYFLEKLPEYSVLKNSDSQTLKIQQEKRPLLANVMPSGSYDIHDPNLLFGEYFSSSNPSPFFLTSNLIPNQNLLDIKTSFLFELAKMPLSEKIVLNVQLRGAGKTKQAYEIAKKNYVVFIDFSGLSLFNYGSAKFEHTTAFIQKVSSNIQAHRKSEFNLKAEQTLFAIISELSSTFLFAGKLFQFFLKEGGYTSIQAFRIALENGSIYNYIFQRLLSRQIVEFNRINFGVFSCVAVIDEAGKLMDKSPPFLFLSRENPFEGQTKCSASLFHPISVGLLGSRAHFNLIGWFFF